MNLTLAPRFSPVFTICLACLGWGFPGAVSSPTLYAAPGLQAELDTRWEERLAALTTPQTLSAAFTEYRHTPLKKKPVVVGGMVRIARNRGLSLSYDTPGAPLVILDEKGLLLRHRDGREQSAPTEAEPDLRLLHALFLFDLEALEQSYTYTLEGDPAASWTLTFSRRPESTSTYRVLTLSGDADGLRGIALVKTPNLRTDIDLAPPALNPGFSPDELTRYFR